MKNIFKKIGIISIACASTCALVSSNVHAFKNNTADEIQDGEILKETKLYKIHSTNDSLELLFNGDPKSLSGVSKDDILHILDDFMGGFQNILAEHIDILKEESRPEDNVPQNPASAPRRLNAYIPNVTQNNVPKALGDSNPSVPQNDPFSDDYELKTSINEDIFRELIDFTFKFSDGTVDEQMLDLYKDNLENENGVFTLLGQYYASRFIDARRENGEEISNAVKNDTIHIIYSETKDLLTEYYGAEVAESLGQKIEYAVTLPSDDERVLVGLPEMTELFDLVTSALNESVSDIEDPDERRQEKKEKLATFVNEFNYKDDNETDSPWVDDEGRDRINRVADELISLMTGEVESIEICNFITSKDQEHFEDIADILEIIEVSEPEMEQIMTNIEASDLFKVVEKIGRDNLRELYDAVDMDFDGEYFNNIVENLKEQMRGLSLQEIINAIDTVHFDDILVFDDGFVGDGLVDLFKEFPRPSVLQYYTDDQMRFTWHVTITTSISDVEFDFTIGFFGDCSAIRKLCGIIADTFSLSVDNGIINIGFKGPEVIKNFYLEFIESDAFSDDFKHEIFDLIFQPFGDMYEEYINNGLQHYLDLVTDPEDGVKFDIILKTLMTGDELNRIFATDRVTFTDSRIDKIINGFLELLEVAETVTYEDVEGMLSKIVDLEEMGLSEPLESLFSRVLSLLKRFNDKEINADVLRAYFDDNDQEHTNETLYALINKLDEENTLYGYFKRGLNFVYNHMSDSQKAKSITDFYKGDNIFNYQGTVELNWKSWLTSALGDTGNKIYMALEVMFDMLPNKVNLNLTADLKGIYSVEYCDLEGNVVKTGLLPETAGANSAYGVGFFANQETINDRPVYKWVEAYANGDDSVVGMPSKDITVRPILSLTKPEITNDGNKFVYDGNTKSLDITYDEEDLTDSLIEINGQGETDAGEYDVSVSLTDNYNYVWEDGSIEDVEGSYTIVHKVDKPTEPSHYSFDATEKDQPYTDEANGYYTVDDTESDLVGTDAGEYETKLVLGDYCEWNNPDNDSDTDPYYAKWHIDKTSVSITYDDSEREYTGVQQNFDITVSPDDSFVDISGDTFGTNSGEYNVSVALKYPESTYWDEDEDDVEDKDIVFTIKNSNISYSVSQTEFIFEENTTIDFEDYISFTNPDDIEITITGDTSGSNAGTYSVTLHITNSNYKWDLGDSISSEDQVVEFIIKRKAIAKPTVGNDLTYSGSSQNCPISEVTGYTNIGDKTKTNSGTYTAKFHLNDNYIWEDETLTDVELTWKILKAKVSLDFVDNDCVYSGANQNYILPDDYDEDIFTVTGTRSAKDVDSNGYTVYFAISNENYEWDSSMESSLDDQGRAVDTWFISKLKIEAHTVNELEFVFDNNTHTVAIEGDSSYFDVSGNSQLHAGNYTIVFTLKDSKNTEFAEGEGTPTTWTILQREIDVEFGDVNLFTYDGNIHTYGVDFDSKYVAISGLCLASNAGDYRISLTLQFPNDTYWSEDLTPNESNEVVRTWSIAKAIVQKPTFDPLSFKYNREEQGFPDFVSTEAYIVNGITKSTEIGEYSFTVSLNNNYIWDDGTVDPLVINWDIYLRPNIIPFLVAPIGLFFGLLFLIIVLLKNKDDDDEEENVGQLPVEESSNEEPIEEAAPVEETTPVEEPVPEEEPAPKVEKPEPVKKPVQPQKASSKPQTPKVPKIDKDFIESVKAGVRDAYKDLHPNIDLGFDPKDINEAIEGATEFNYPFYEKKK